MYSRKIGGGQSELKQSMSGEKIPKAKGLKIKENYEQRVAEEEGKREFYISDW